MIASAIDKLLANACGSVFTAAVARVEYRGHLAFERAYGVTREDETSRPVFVDTRFDLASLTKLFVATLVLRDAAAGTIALDEPLERAMTPRMLLAHTSGMNSGADYRILLERNVKAFVASEPLVATPGERVIYSDLGFIALGMLLQRVHGISLAALADAAFESPTLGFRPRASTRLEIPATECDSWRGRVQGVVHDEKAYLMGGVAGHAGLFGTAADVAALADVYLAPLCGRTPRSSIELAPALVREAVCEQAYDPVLRRGLGWALKTTDENSCGARFSMESFGHTGFVGTCVWADPRRDLCGVLLTNGVYFGRNDIRDLRAAFYDACVEMVVP
ncbi:MAG: serine hydrolase domain-containing protein [Candidatus Tyrphobacter sp.]